MLKVVVYFLSAESLEDSTRLRRDSYCLPSMGPRWEIGTAVQIGHGQGDLPCGFCLEDTDNCCSVLSKEKD